MKVVDIRTKKISKIEKEYLTVSEAAKILNVSPMTLRNWDKKGIFKAKRHPLNNYRIYPLSEIKKLLEKLNQS